MLTLSFPEESLFTRALCEISRFARNYTRCFGQHLCYSPKIAKRLARYIIFLYLCIVYAQYRNTAPQQPSDTDETGRGGGARNALRINQLTTINNQTNQTRQETMKRFSTFLAALLCTATAIFADGPFRNHRYDSFKVLNVTSDNKIGRASCRERV